MMRTLALAFPLAVIVLLSGCSAITGPRDDFSIYVLEPPIERGAGVPVDWQLLVEQPHMSDLLDGFRIVVAPNGNERQVYKGARWVERTPSMLQGIWVRAFEADGRVPGASRAGTGVRADLLLATDVTAFHAVEQAGSATVEVSVHARLVEPRERRIRAREVFHARVEATGTSVPAVVAAFEAALGEVNPALVEWTVREGERALAAASGDVSGSGSASASSR
jgi:cholesterol transport system auxiliary component